MRLPRNRRSVRLELLPLMDVVFLLLLFLVYAMLSMSVYRGMAVTLPESSSVRQEREVVLALTIQKDGAMWLDKKPADLATLPQAIRDRARTLGLTAGEEPLVQIFADADLIYQKLFHVLDVLKNAGLKKVSLQARQGG